MSNLNDTTTWRRSTAGGIPYRLVDTSGEFQFNDSTVTETYIIQTSQLLDFMLESFPIPVIKKAKNGTKFIFHPKPRRLGNLAALSTTTISWKAFEGSRPIDPFGFDSTAPAGTYDEFCTLSIQYSTGNQEKGAENDDPDETDPETFLEITCSATGEFLHTTIPNGKFKGAEPDPDEDIAPGQGPVVEDDPEVALNQGPPPPAAEDGDGEEKEIKERVPVTILVPQLEWNIRWSHVPYNFLRDTLINRLRRGLGKVNSNRLSWLFNAPVGTMLFVGFNMSRETSWHPSVGIVKPDAKLDLKFIEKNVSIPVRGGDVKTFGHNDFFNSKTGTWERLLLNGRTVYRTANFNEIFAI